MLKTKLHVNFIRSQLKFKWHLLVEFIHKVNNLPQIDLFKIPRTNKCLNNVIDIEIDTHKTRKRLTKKKKLTHITS
jgi:hypothetical protein